MGNFYQAVASSKSIPINRFLDIYTGSAAAYSLRRLRSGYSGPAITIRRDSDNAEQNIGWDGNDVVDVNSIINFCGSANGYVKTWYDQTTNSFNISQSTISTQPQVYDGTTGVVTTPSLSNINTKPAINESGGVSNPQLSFSNFTAELNGGYSYYAVMDEPGYNQNIFRVGNNTSDQVFMESSTTGQPTHKQGNSGINVVTTGYPNVGQRIAGFGIMQSAHYDGATSGSVFITRDDGYNFIGTKGNFSSLGSTAGGVPINILMGSMTRPVQEFIIFDEDKSSVRKEIESNLNDYYTVGQLNHDLPLDTYTDVFSAYSLRKLRSAYTGNCIEVYNGTSYADIGFTSQNELDIEALNTHCGSNNGLISKWYDQSTTANTAVQTATGSMPQIYNGSTQQVLIDNGKPFASATNSVENCFLRAPVIPSLTNASHFMVVSRDAIGASTSRAILVYGRFGNQNDTEYSVLGGNGGSAQVGADLHINGIPNSATQKNTFYNALGSSYRIVNSQKNYQSGDAVVFGIGQGTYNMFETKEIIIFNSDQSNNRAAIEANLNKYWKVY